VITGEGSFDSQSMCGKVLTGVLARAEKAGVAAAVVCGRHGADASSGPPVFSGADLPGAGPGGMVDLDGLRILAGMAARRVLQS